MLTAARLGNVKLIDCVFFHRMQDRKLQFVIINTSFTKECTKGADDEWTMDDLNFLAYEDVEK